MKKVAINPFSIGKRLGNDWFRELKNEKFRLYYWISENKPLVLLLATSEKKDQATVIEGIKKNLHHFEFLTREKQESYLYSIFHPINMDVELKKLIAKRDRLLEKVTQNFIDLRTGKIRIGCRR